jgi:hypothetical protein
MIRVWAVVEDPTPLIFPEAFLVAVCGVLLTVPEGYDVEAMGRLPFVIRAVFPPGRAPFFGTGKARSTRLICFADEARTVPIRWLKNNAEPGTVVDPPRLWKGGLIRVVSEGPGRVKPEIWNGTTWVSGGTLLDADRGIPADFNMLSHFGVPTENTVFPKEAREHVLRCLACQSEGRFEDGLSEAQAALQLEPANADAYYGLGRCHHELARQANRRAGGNIYFSAGLEQLNGAIGAFQQVVRLQPNMPDGFLNLGLACDNACRLDEAERYYREAIRLDPSGIDGADACWNLALMLRMRATDCAGKNHFPELISFYYPNADLKAAFSTAEMAIEIAERTVASNPDYKKALIAMHRALGHWYQDTLLGEDAIPHFQAVLKLKPQDVEATEWLQLAEKNTGRKLL